MASLAPTNLTTAISDMETAFNNLAGRSDPTAIALGAGNLTGLTSLLMVARWPRLWSRWMQ